jgi:hypothetical protein
VQLSFEVGTTERHQVRFSFNKFWGNLRITVDVVRTVRLASIDLVKRYDFVVGATEQFHVHIEKHRQGSSPVSGRNRCMPTSTANSLPKASPDQHMGRMEPTRVPTGIGHDSGVPAIWHDRSRLSNAFADSYRIAIVTRGVRAECGRSGRSDVNGKLL